MKRILNDMYSPVTDSIGFLECPFDIVLSTLSGWMRSLDNNSKILAVVGNLSCALAKLEPLNRPRTSLVASTCSPWTAVFLADESGSGPQSIIGHLSRQIPCNGLLITCVDDTFDRTTKKGRFGGVQFRYLSVEKQEFLNYRRSIGAVNDCGRWVFVEDGIPLDFEDPEKLKAKRIRDRFTPEHLEAYCKALGIQVFDEEYYGPRFSIVSPELEPSENIVPRGFRDARIALGMPG